jgi:hypothetical protein
MDYVCTISQNRYFGDDEMSEGERRIYCNGIMNRKIKSMILDVCWKSTVRMTSLC